MDGGEVFGTTAAGEPVRRLSIFAGGLSAKILTWGAVVQDLRLAGHAAPLVLGFDRFDDYPAHVNYFGAVAGRYANRIAGGRFTIDGTRHQADLNDNGNTLHGGADGIFRRVWELAGHGPGHVTLELRDPDGHMGFPGTLDISCTYRVTVPGTLSVELTATTDRATLCNLAQHSYFNLDDGGASDVLGHRLALPAAAYTPVDATLIPTGVVEPVAGTGFDFRTARPIRLTPDGIAYDHNFCLAASRGELRQAAWLQGRETGVEMEIWTTEPGIQLYDGAFIGDLVGLDGIRHRKHSGLCLEPQVWPDSPNRPYFPQAVLRPGETYRQLTEFRFRLPQDG